MNTLYSTVPFSRTALQFEDTPDTPNSVRIKARNLYAAAVDQILASEELVYDSAWAATVKNIAWQLADQKGSVRDIVFSSFAGGGSSKSVHFKYDSFGFATNIEAGSVAKTRFAGQDYDPETGLYYKNGKYYDSHREESFRAARRQRCRFDELLPGPVQFGQYRRR